MQRVQAFQFPRHGYRIVIKAERRGPSRGVAGRLASASRFLSDGSRYRHAVHASMLLLALAVSLMAAAELRT